MEYKPLDFTTFEFRLLTILPLEDGDGDQDKTIRCSLSHSLLIEPPEYHALSYCWGDPGSTATIIVNGNPTRVTKNLETALWELRYRQIQTIWVDALCINQNDLVERGLQVPRMGLIYSRAVEVIVWLGGEADDSKKAMACLKQVSRSN
ncbi:heterokaryon incompatibility protein-domain-containing protein, partial [Tricladium varicosporioides]